MEEYCLFLSWLDVLSGVTPNSTGREIISGLQAFLQPNCVSPVQCARGEYLVAGLAQVIRFGIFIDWSLEGKYPKFCRLFLTKSAFLWGKL